MKFYHKRQFSIKIFSNVVYSIIFYKIMIIHVDVRVSRLIISFYFASSIFNMPKVTPKKRKSLTAAQKKEICLKKISKPFLK